MDEISYVIPCKNIHVYKNSFIIITKSDELPVYKKNIVGRSEFSNNIQNISDLGHVQEFLRLPLSYAMLKYHQMVSTNDIT